MLKKKQSSIESLGNYITLLLLLLYTVNGIVNIKEQLFYKEKTDVHRVK